MNLQLLPNLQYFLNHQAYVKSELARLRRYDEELSKVMPQDFKDWWQGSKEEWPEIAASVIVERRRSEELAWEMLNSKCKDQCNAHADILDPDIEDDDAGKLLNAQLGLDGS